MIKIEKYQLKNGLKVLVHQDKSTQMAAVNLLYNVGARDENPNKTGFAHLFEHLMFGGSKNIPNYDTVLQKVGGDNNAWTNNDYTNYYITLPAQNIETAFWLESDRMLELNFSQEKLDIQKGVVIEEYKQRYLNQPYGDLPLLTRPLAYKKHPYSWPTIGKDISHIENATLEDVKSFFFTHYAPNNAVLSVVGNVNPDDIFKLADKWFGEIPVRNVPVRNLPVEDKRTAQDVLEVERDVPSNLLILNFNMEGRSDVGYYSSDLLSDILANGTSARLTQELTKNNRYFSAIDAYITGSVDPGLFTVVGRLMPSVNMNIAEDAVWKELQKLQDKKVEESELQKVKNKIEANLIFAEIGFLNKAINIAQYEMLGDSNNINDEVNKYASVTVEELQTKASSLFQKENSSVLRYMSKNK